MALRDPSAINTSVPAANDRFPPQTPPAQFERALLPSLDPACSPPASAPPSRKAIAVCPGSIEPVSVYWLNADADAFAAPPRSATPSTRPVPGPAISAVPAPMSASRPTRPAQSRLTSSEHSIAPATAPAAAPPSTAHPSVPTPAVAATHTPVTATPTRIGVTILTPWTTSSRCSAANCPTCAPSCLVKSRAIARFCVNSPTAAVSFARAALYSLDRYSFALRRPEATAPTTCVAAPTTELTAAPTLEVTAFLT